MKYVKLFDGGLIDNYGLSGITILRAAQATPYGPLRPAEAVNLRRFLFLVVDAGQGPQGNWSKTLEGPAGKELVSAVVDVLVSANAHASYAAFEATMRNWRNSIVRWRCGLKRARGGAAARRPRRALELPRPEDHRRARVLRRSRTPRAPRRSTTCRPRSRCRSSRSMR